MFVLRFGCWGIVAASLHAASPALAVQVVATVEGRVVAHETGQPVEDARVQFEGLEVSATTDTEGRFRLSVTLSGRQTLVVSREGFETIRASVEVGSAGATAVEVRLPFQLDLREAVAVVGRTVGELGLAAPSAAASRLGLSVLETPASVDVLESTVMEARGYQKVSDAVSSMAGVVSGEHPTAPSSFVVRGFTANQVSTLRDGIWLGPSTMVMRPQNTFNLDRIELLRGPSSVINGQGAVAGTINAVTKTAEPTSAMLGQALFSYGSFNTYHAAAGAVGPLGHSLWYRIDASRSGSDGFVDRMDSGSTNLTGSLLWRPTARVGVKASVDFLDDDLAKYFGTPLVPVSAAAEPLDVIRTTTGETIDGRTRSVNYNVEDGFAQSRQLVVRGDFSWQLSDRVALANVVYGFDADRRWRNAEGYVYCTAVVDVCTSIGQISRYYGYFRINHDQQIFGDRLTLNVNTKVGGRENRALVGFEASTLDFERTRGFRIRVPLAPGDSVDPLNPVPGTYGQEEIRGISPTGIGTWGLFVEDSLAVTSRLRLAGALRYDGLDLDRVNLDASRNVIAGGFTRTYNWWSWRAGAVVNLRPDVVAYGQYSNARDPVSANIFLVNANQNFDLTQAEQWEIGVKADLAAGRTQVTATYFDIARDDVLERFALDSTTNIGGIDSHGVEFAGSTRLGGRTSVGANLAITDASYRPSANFVRFAGNRPPNVAPVAANAWASYQRVANLPIEIGGSARFVGDRFASNANRIEMKRYTVVDAYVAWTRDRLRVTARVDNVANTTYASWADPFYIEQNDPSFLYSHELMLGTPRAFSVQLQVGF
ncbi:MAG TPA: TonB-dependent siderophore receptor [Vicinamibacterales bacterium]